MREVNEFERLIVVEEMRKQVQVYMENPMEGW